MTSAKEWWRRATAAVKDKRSLCLTKVAGGFGHRNPDMEAAVIRATSHDERSIDYKNAGRVFAWAMTSPSFFGPLMWAVARRAERTRCWAVALKSLMLTHGILRCSDANPSSSSYSPIGRLPFDLSDFRDRSSHPSTAWGFSSFIRAYFHFLDQRPLLLLTPKSKGTTEGEDQSVVEEEEQDDDRKLERVEKLQTLLDLLMQIQPYADGLEVGLILEAMDCVVMEIFEVYSGICNGIACFLVGILGSSSYSKSKGKEGEEERRRRGLLGIRVLRKAAEQSSQLSAYFEVCRVLGILNWTEFPPVESIPEEDIMDLEKMVLGGISGMNEEVLEEKGRGVEGGGTNREVVEEKGLFGQSETVVTKDWVVFEDEIGAGTAAAAAVLGYFGNPFMSPVPDRLWASSLVSMVHPCAVPPPRADGNLIELV